MQVGTQWYFPGGYFTREQYDQIVRMMDPLPSGSCKEDALTGPLESAVPTQSALQDAPFHLVLEAEVMDQIEAEVMDQIAKVTNGSVDDDIDEQADVVVNQTDDNHPDRVDNEVPIPHELLDESLGPRKTGRTSKPPVWIKDYVVPKKTSLYSITDHVCYDHLSNIYQDYVKVFPEIIEPQSFKEASQDERWVPAMQQEINELEDNHTWSIVDFPPETKTIGSKWVYKIKYKSNGSKQDLLLKDTHKDKDLTIMRPFPL